MKILSKRLTTRLVIAVKNESNFKTIDIRGKICPMTFVHTKVNLEKMESGELLDIVLDYAPALKNIPKSCNQQNLAELVSIKKISNSENRYNEWIMRLKKLEILSSELLSSCNSR